MGCICAKPSQSNTAVFSTGIEKSQEESSQVVFAEKVRSGQPTAILQENEINANGSVEEVKAAKKPRKSSKRNQGKKFHFKIKENFDLQLLDTINSLRTDPRAFAEKVIKALNLIKEEGGRVIIETENGSKIALSKGVAAFEACAEKLRALEPLPPLEFRQELCVPVPEAPSEWKEQSKLQMLINKFREDCSGTYSGLAFNLDIGVNDPELSTVLQVVDDSGFKGQRADNLLNKDLKYCGISHASKGKKQFCAYIMFAK